MPDIETLRSLLVRVEAATGPDRELDGRIWAATAGVTILEWDGAGALWKDEHGGLRHQRDDRIPAYTASIDAAVALIDRVLPNSLIRLSNEYQGFWRATVRLSGGRGRPTAPFALVAALLRALIAKEEAHVESE